MAKSKDSDPVEPGVAQVLAKVRERLHPASTVLSSELERLRRVEDKLERMDEELQRTRELISAALGHTTLTKKRIRELKGKL